MAPRGPFTPSGEEPSASRRLKFMPSSRTGSDAGSGGAGAGGPGASGFCDPEAFSETSSVRSGQRRAPKGPGLSWANDAGLTKATAATASTMEPTMNTPTDTCLSARTGTPGETASDSSGGKAFKKNAFSRNTSVGNLEGYHGVRVERHVTNKRLFGLGPCQRSSVDEVVYGRDMDGSLGDNSNAEIDVLLNMFEGAAGRKLAIAEMLEDVPGTGCRGPDDDVRLCLRSAERIAEQGFEGCAGKQTREPRDMKRAWRRLPMQKSNVAEIVYGQNCSHVSGHEQLFISQFSRSAGYSPRIKKTGDDGIAAHPTAAESLTRGTASNRRAYLTNTISCSSGIHGAMETTKKAVEKQVQAGTLRDLADSFHGAAGKSPRFALDTSGRASTRSTAHPVYCVYS